MSSFAARDPLKDELLTPQNSCLIIIDYQPIQITSIRSMDPDVLVHNIVSVAKTARLFKLPLVLSTVNVKAGKNQPTIPALRSVLNPVTEIDRTTVNAWEDLEFHAAVKAVKRRKLIICALWTEVCLCFPVLDALREGYDVYPVVDAVGGTSVAAHKAGLARMIQAGARPSSSTQLICELQRDWNRVNTAPQFAEILFGGRNKAKEAVV